MARDHGGGLDGAIALHGGARSDWLDLSTGINPVPYPIGAMAPDVWTALPDQHAQERLITAARSFWDVPAEAQIVAAPGASALIALMPELVKSGLPHDSRVHIQQPTYNEHAAAFAAHDFEITSGQASVRVYVHPNNPDGRLHEAGPEGAGLTIIDESFCDTMPDASHIARCAVPGTVVLKSFGKFWGLAGLRLGFAIAHPSVLQPEIEFKFQTGVIRRKTRTEILRGVSLPDLLGPWPVAGPALDIGARALADEAWTQATRDRLAQDAKRLDALMTDHGAVPIGGTTLFRLYEVDNAGAWQEKLARGKIWSRVFPYSDRWLRLGLPAPDRWDQLSEAL